MCNILGFNVFSVQFTNYHLYIYYDWLPLQVYHLLAKKQNPDWLPPLFVPPVYMTKSELIPY